MIAEGQPFVLKMTNRASGLRHCPALNTNELNSLMPVEKFAPLGPKAQDLVGETFGRLKVVQFGGRVMLPSGKQRLSWLCVCECANQTTVESNHLMHGKIRSCGCFRNDCVAQRKSLHGYSKHPLFDVWNAMIQRCTNPRVAAWKYYGARGINVCKEWLDVAVFIRDMWPSYRPGLEIERKNNNSGYSPDNCCWATRRQQMLNTRRSKKNVHQINSL